MQCPQFTQSWYVSVGGGWVGSFDLSGPQPESFFWEYSFIAGDLDAFPQLRAVKLVADCLYYRKPHSLKVMIVSVQLLHQLCCVYM